MRLIRWKSHLAAVVLLVTFGCTPGAEPEQPINSGTDVSSNPAAPPAAAPSAAAPSEPSEKPSKPLTLAAPSVSSSDAGGQDISKLESGELEGRAMQFANQGKPREAARYQYWAVKGGAAGLYNLACWTALAGDVDGAFYWLQEAALDDGVDAAWAGQDSDLKSLRNDARWKQIAPFLKRCNTYWAAGGPRQTLLVLPEGYQKGTPIGVLIGMHGRGDQPAGYADPSQYQPFADELNMAIVGVSGTQPTGRRSFVWSEDPQVDARQIRRALEDVSDRLTIKPGHLIAFGFSQGAQMGFEVAFQNPGDYRGAIVMSPGTSSPFGRLERLRPVAANSNQGYVFLCGAEEAPGNVIITKENADFARKAGSKVEMKLYEGMNRHAFPPDFVASFVRWVRFIDGSGSESKVQ